jgi:hypothetical protein
VNVFRVGSRVETKVKMTRLRSHEYTKIKISNCRQKPEPRARAISRSPSSSFSLQELSIELQSFLSIVEQQWRTILMRPSKKASHYFNMATGI